MANTGIYHNGITAQPFTCDLVLHGDSLYIYLHDENRSLIIWSYQSFNSCHLNGSSLVITNGSYPHETLECSGEIAKSIYEAWSKNNIIRQAEGFVFKEKGMAVLVLCVVFLVLCFLSYFVILPWVGEKAASLVPVSTEIEMGQRMSEAFTRGNEINDSATYYANRFIQQLQLENTYPLHVQVVKSPEINAFALPGGNIVIYTGILEKMDSYEEMTALLGHEVTHVVNRHSLKSICRTMASSLLIATLFGDLTGISSAILQQADQFKQLDYSRELETEADNNGLSIMVQNRVSPRGMVNLLELLKTESLQMPAMMKYLSTHPETEERIANIKSNAEVNRTFPENTGLEASFKGLKRNL